MSAQDDQTTKQPARSLPSLQNPAIIRSIMRGLSDSPDRVLENICTLRESGLDFELLEDGQIWAFVDKFAKTYGHAPELQTVVAGLRTDGYTQAIDRIEMSRTAPLTYGGDFAQVVAEVIEARRCTLIKVAMRDGVLALVKEVEVGKGKEKHRIFGSTEAAGYLIEQLAPYASMGRTGASGEVTGLGVAEAYIEAKNNPRAAMGQLTGIKQMDEAIGGARVGELWIHAAFSGHLKTTLALNWAYNQSVWFHENVLYFSLEMPYPQVRRWLIAMHSCHHKFRDVRIALGLQVAGGADVGLDYKKIRDAQLGPIEEQYFLDYVVRDWDDPNNEYGRIIVETADPDKPDITVDALKGRAETIYPKTPFSMVFIDHASLLGSRSKYNSTTDRLNESMRDLKNSLAINFRRGQGIPVVALFQINREGLKEALKRKEKGQLPTYEITSLSYANEAERSADVVTATYLDKDYADRERALLTCLKARDNAPFDPALVEIEWPSRRVWNCLENPMGVGAQGAEISGALDALNQTLEQK